MIQPIHEILVPVAYASSECRDEPAHLCSVNRAFTVCTPKNRVVDKALAKIWVSSQSRVVDKAQAKIRVFSQSRVVDKALAKIRVSSSTR